MIYTHKRKQSENDYCIKKLWIAIYKCFSVRKILTKKFRPGLKLLVGVELLKKIFKKWAITLQLLTYYSQIVIGTHTTKIKSI